MQLINNLEQLNNTEYFKYSVHFNFEEQTTITMTQDLFKRLSKVSSLRFTNCNVKLGDFKLNRLRTIRLHNSTITPTPRCKLLIDKSFDYTNLDTDIINVAAIDKDMELKNVPSNIKYLKVSGFSNIDLTSVKDSLEQLTIENYRRENINEEVKKCKNLQSLKITRCKHVTDEAYSKCEKLDKLMVSKCKGVQYTNLNTVTTLAIDSAFKPYGRKHEEFQNITTLTLPLESITPNVLSKFHNVKTLSIIYIPRAPVLNVRIGLRGITRHLRKLKEVHVSRTVNVKLDKNSKISVISKDY